MERIAIVFWSGTGNTEAMAEAIAEGIKEANGEIQIYAPGNFVESDLDNFTQIAFGCPSMGEEVLEEEEFEPMFSALEGSLAGKKVALFGSYSWGDGEWMRQWEERTRNSGALLFEEGLIIQEMPDEDGKAACRRFGRAFAAF